MMPSLNLALVSFLLLHQLLPSESLAALASESFPTKEKLCKEMLGSEQPRLLNILVDTLARSEGASISEAGVLAETQFYKQLDSLDASRALRNILGDRPAYLGTTKTGAIVAAIPYPRRQWMTIISAKRLGLSNAEFNAKRAIDQTFYLSQPRMSDRKKPISGADYWLNIHEGSFDRWVNDIIDTKNKNFRIARDDFAWSGLGDAVKTHDSHGEFEHPYLIRSLIIRAPSVTDIEFFVKALLKGE